MNRFLFKDKKDIIKNKIIKVLKKILPDKIQRFIKRYLKGSAGFNIRREFLFAFNEYKFSNIEKVYGGTHKKFLFDILFCQGGFHGGGEYGKAVFSHLVKTLSARNDVVLFITVNPDLYIEDWMLDLYKKNRKFIKLLIVKSFEDIAVLVNKDVFDVFFAPAIVMYAKGYRYLVTHGEKVAFDCKKTKVIGTLHDIRDFELSNENEKIFQFKKSIGCRHENNISLNERIEERLKVENYRDGLKVMYQNFIDCSSIFKIITVSDYSKNSMRSRLKIVNDRIEVFYSCMKNRVAPSKFKYKDVDFNEIKYLLAVNVGSSRSEKNGSALVKAMDTLFSDSNRFKDYYVVLTGVDSISDFDLLSIENIENFIPLGFLEPQHLEYLYKNAKCLLYTSFNEGFGYPPIEAMSYNVPSVVSRVTSIPEICGDAAVYCDPFDIESIKNAILECIENPPSVNALEERYNFITGRQKQDLNKLVSLLME